MQEIYPCEIYIKQNSVLNNLQAPWLSQDSPGLEGNKSQRPSPSQETQLPHPRVPPDLEPHKQILTDARL